uniref:CCHC-type domain-containing protein n=1 Tax=Ditylenchus dipsaci TaxID=166011 RepID=A0A915CS40_9BILA
MMQKKPVKIGLRISSERNRDSPKINNPKNDYLRFPRSTKSYISEAQTSSSISPQQPTLAFINPPSVPTTQQPKWPCIFCQNQQHYSSKCSMTREERFKKLRELQKCFKCLRNGHAAKDCASTCGWCAQNHHRILCPNIWKPSPTSRNQQQGNTGGNTTPLGTGADIGSRGLTATHLRQEKKWWNGPEFLQKTEQEYPSNPQIPDFWPGAVKTILVQVEAIINSRPITFLSHDQTFPQPLSPSDFLMPLKGGVPPTELADSEYTPQKSTRETLLELWEKQLQALNSFWCQWSADYLLSLKERYQKITQSRPVPKVGEVVLVWQEKMPRGLWRYAVITALLKNSDQAVSNAEIRFANGRTSRRSIGHLFPLETSEEFENRALEHDHQTVQRTSSGQSSGTQSSSPLAERTGGFQTSRILRDREKIKKPARFRTIITDFEDNYDPDGAI